MKKLLLLTLCIVSCSVFATDKWYESLAGAEAGLTALNGAVTWETVRLTVAKAYFENENMTYDEFKTLVSETALAYKRAYGQDGVNSFVIDIAGRLDNGKFIDNVIADTALHNNSRFVVRYKLGITVIAKIKEYSTIFEDKDTIYKEFALTYNDSWLAGQVVDQYIKDNIMNKDTTVLEVFYAAYYDKITMDAWKPIVTKIALNLKRRGIEVK